MNKYVLKESPLVMVLVDLRFSQLPKNNLNAGLEKFKSSLFSLGLSVQNESDVKQVRATSNANSPIDIKEIITKRWDFINIDKNKGVILTDGSLCFRTTTYENFEGFKEFWRGIVDAFYHSFDGVEHAGMSRMGLRYIDVFVPQKEESYTDYVDTNWLSSKQKNSSSQSLFSNRQLINTSHGRLRLELEECVPQNGRVRIFPLDISDPERAKLTVDIKPSWEDIGLSKYALLDIDHAWEATNQLMPLSKDNIYDKLEKLHDDSSKIFWDILSEHAEYRWGKNIFKE